MLLLMLLIGWVVLLPAFVVAGLYTASSVLGRRRAAVRAYEDLFLDEEYAEMGHSGVVADATADQTLARLPAMRPERTPEAA